MASRGNFGFEFDFGTSASHAQQKASEETPFRIAILADLSGRANRGVCQTGAALAGRKLISVDVDNLDELPRRLGTEITIPAGEDQQAGITIGFGELDDFHPDAIYDRLEIFQELKSLRSRLQNTQTFPEAAAQIRSMLSGPVPEPSAGDDTAGKPSPESDADTMQRLLGKAASAQTPTPIASKTGKIDALIREAVAPYIVPAPDPLQGEMLSQLDQAITAGMRSVIHHRDFQLLEAAWRCVHFLVSQLETDETLKIYVLDISKAELAADLGSGNGLQTTGLYKLIVDQTVGMAGAQPWTILSGCYTFDMTNEDVALLGQLGQIAHMAGAPFLAGGHGRFVGCESFGASPDVDDWKWQADNDITKKWEHLRAMPASAYVGLTMPRMLMRLPYGKDSDPIDRFDFEELTSPREHEGYLWGSSAILCALLLGSAFTESGWNLTGTLGRDLTGLPMYSYSFGGQTQVTPCGEAYLTERAMEKIMNSGFIPIVSFKNRDAVRIGRFQSISKPAASLAGRWT
ncbi:MAG: type VI secretion system contractile sheath large subunit [Sedimentisphaerales bacterium]|nr:type VI secretion system contractile sheath large subunit [Sedimentisphaerales bacterium]